MPMSVPPSRTNTASTSTNATLQSSHSIAANYEHSSAFNPTQASNSSHAVRSVSVTALRLPASATHHQQIQHQQLQQLLHQQQQASAKPSSIRYSPTTAPIQMHRSISAEPDLPGRIALQRLHDQMSQSPTRPHAHKHPYYAAVSPQSPSRSPCVTAAIPVEALPPACNNCSSVPRHSIRSSPVSQLQAPRANAQYNPIPSCYPVPENDYPVYAGADHILFPQPAHAISPSQKMSTPSPLHFGSPAPSFAPSHTSSLLADSSDYSYSSPDSVVCVRHLSASHSSSHLSSSAPQTHAASEPLSSVDGMTAEDWSGLVKSYRSLRSQDE